MRNYVLFNHFEFKEKDLLKIILNYAPTFDKKLKLFEEAAHSLSDKKMRILAEKRIDYENRQYSAFMQPSPDTVYQIKIKTDTEETFITKTFDDAVTLIKGFLKYYEIKGEERSSARYTLTKMTTNPPAKPSDFSYKYSKIGSIGECVLNDKFQIIYLDMDNFGLEVKCKANTDCEECDRCIDNMFSTRFPHFLKPHDLVAYYDDWIYDPKHLTYAVFDFDMEECDYDSRVITLEDNPYIQNRNGDFQDENGYYRVYDAHEHPSCFKIIKPDIQDVPQNILDDYHYAVAVLKKIEAV